MIFRFPTTNTNPLFADLCCDCKLGLDQFEIGLRYKTFYGLVRHDSYWLGYRYWNSSDWLEINSNPILLPGQNQIYLFILEIFSLLDSAYDFFIIKVVLPMTFQENKCFCACVTLRKKFIQQNFFCYPDKIFCCPNKTFCLSNKICLI